MESLVGHRPKHMVKWLLNYKYWYVPLVAFTNTAKTLAWCGKAVLLLRQLFFFSVAGESGCLNLWFQKFLIIHTAAAVAHYKHDSVCVRVCVCLEGWSLNFLWTYSHDCSYTEWLGICLIVATVVWKSRFKMTALTVPVQDLYYSHIVDISVTPTTFIWFIFRLRETWSQYTFLHFSQMRK